MFPNLADLQYPINSKIYHISRIRYNLNQKSGGEPKKFKVDKLFPFNLQPILRRTDISCQYAPKRDWTFYSLAGIL